MNPFDTSFVSSIYLINNCDYLLCSFYFMKIKIHQCSASPWLNGDAPSWPLCQSNPKRKTDQRWLFRSFCKVHFQRLLEKFVPHGNMPSTEKMLWKCRMQPTSVVLLEKKCVWYSSYLVMNMKFLPWKVVCLHQEELWYILCSCIWNYWKDLIRLTCKFYKLWPNVMFPFTY